MFYSNINSVSIPILLFNYKIYLLWNWTAWRRINFLSRIIVNSNLLNALKLKIITLLFIIFIQNRLLELNQSKAESFVGTPAYMSPELFKHLPYNHKVSLSVKFQFSIFRIYSKVFKKEEFNAMYINLSWSSWLLS